MKELKTLKDLREQEGVNVGDSIFRESTLKAEAVKWVKEIIKTDGRKKQGDVLYWIENFFNITEEDNRN